MPTSADLMVMTALHIPLLQEQVMQGWLFCTLLDQHLSFTDEQGSMISSFAAMRAFTPSVTLFR